MQKHLKKTIYTFSKWLKSTNYLSYDQYDFWSTSYGKWAKKIYYKNHKLGIPLVIPIFLLDTFFPSSRKLFVKPKRFPIADAHLLMGFLNLFKYYNKQEYLDKAKDLYEDLLKQSISGYSGLCWGYPFDWETNRGLWEKGLPLITSTPYVFEAFLMFYDLTKEQKYLDSAYSIVEFAYNDINETKINDEVSASSYSPIDHSFVNNASAYNGYLHIEAYKRFGDNKYLEKGKRFLNFLLHTQQQDGSWLYAINNPQDEFIDNFHTCFVLKNLAKANRILNDKNITEAIIKGFQFYKNNLFYDEKTPKPYAYLKRLNLVKVDLYDYAEGINLGIVLKNIIPGALNKSILLAKEVLKNYSTPKGYFITKINLIGQKNKVPYLRWAQAQLFYALSKLLLQTKNENKQ